MFAFRKVLCSLLVITAICSFEQEAFGQGTVNDVVRTQTIGSEVHILVDAAALDLFGDSVITSLNPDSDAKWNTWKDVLTNSNSPGMDVNFDSFSAYGLTNVDGTGDLTLGTITMTGFIIDGVGNATAASLNNSNGGITNTGLIAGATDVDGSGDLTMGTVTMTGFSVDADGDVVSKSLDNTSGGITNAGSIAGATTITASGTVQAEQLTSTDDLTVADVANIDGTLDLATGSITDQSGAISFGDENLSTTGTASTGNLTVTGTGSFSSTTSAASGSTIGTLTLADGSVTDSSGSISFGDENLSTTGDFDISAGTLTLADDQISGDKVSGGTIGTVTIGELAGAMNANSQAMTNVNIDSGSIDGTPIGSTTPSTVAASTLNSGNATLTGTLDVSGNAEFNAVAKFDGNIGNSQAEAPAVYIGVSSASDPQIQLQGGTGTGSPHIDFANFYSQDADARLILTGDDDFQLQGSDLTIAGGFDLAVSGAAGVDGNFDVNTDKFYVAAATGNTSVAGTLNVTGQTDVTSLVASGATTLNAALDLNADLDADGADIDLDATNDISLDAGAASNFTTSAGALTLEGAGGVTVTSTGGTLALNGAGQTVDLDATTLDVDATTITVDATTTTFTGDVKGPKATGDDEFVTYWQLDSLANTSPYHESVMIIKKGNTPQTIIEVNGNGHDPAVSFADNPSLMFEFESDASENGDFIDYPLGPDYLQVNQTGVYTVDVSMELATSSQGMFPVTLVVRNTDALDIASQQDVELAASTVWVSPTAAPSYWVSTTMTVIMDNVNEKLHMDLLPYGGSTDVISYKFVVSRIGAE